MTDQKISQLTSATPAGTDEFPINQSGTTKKVTLTDVTTYAGANVTIAESQVTNLTTDLVRFV